MKLWIDFYDYYLTDIPGCPHATAANALRSAAQEFCKRTKAWRATLEPVITVAGNSVYPFDLPDGQEVAKVVSAELDTYPIELLLHDQVEQIKRGVIAITQRQFYLQPVPADGQSLIIKVVLMPSNDAAGVDDVVYAMYAEAIAEGAKARLFSKSNQPYTDVRAAGLAQAKFMSEIDMTSMKVAKAFSSAPLRIRPSFM